MYIKPEDMDDRGVPCLGVRKRGTCPPPAIDGHPQGVPLLGCLLMLLYLIFIWLMEIQQWKQIFLKRGKPWKVFLDFLQNFQCFLEIFSNFIESYSNFLALFKTPAKFLKHFIILLLNFINFFEIFSNYLTNFFLKFSNVFPDYIVYSHMFLNVNKIF